MLRVVEALEASFSEMSEHVAVDWEEASGKASRRGRSERRDGVEGDIIDAIVQKRLEAVQILSERKHWAS
jgi:hypothetical protein